MRKLAIVLAAVIAASLSAPSAEAAAKKKAAAAKPDPAVAARQNTAKLFHDMFRGPAPEQKTAKGKKGKKRG
jgi:hypothetical protein